MALGAHLFLPAWMPGGGEVGVGAAWFGSRSGHHVEAYAGETLAFAVSVAARL